MLSDVHSAQSRLTRVINLYGNTINGIIFAGDGLLRVLSSKKEYPVYAVRGNVDEPLIPTELEFELDHLKIFLTHGHKYQVKQSLQLIKTRAFLPQYDLLIFGHTHKAYKEKFLSTTFFNPGSLMNDSYGMLYIEENDFYIEHETLN